MWIASTYRFSLLIAAFAFMVSLFSSPATAASYRLVTLQYPPYEYVEDGEVKGLAVEIVREVFKLLKHEINIEVYPWARSIEMLKNGEADGIFTFFKTPEREAFTLYSKEVFLMQKMALWTRNDSTISFSGDLAELSKFRIGTVRKTSYGSVFDQAAANGSIKALESYTIEECIKQLLNGRLDFWVSNYHGALYQLKQAGISEQVKMLKPFIEDIPTYIGFSKKKMLAKLRDEFDRAFIELKRSGRYDEILRHYQD